MNQSIISLQNVEVHDQTDGTSLLRRLNIDVKRGEMIGLIGESGSGKSLTAKAIMGLLPTTMAVTGRIFYKQNNLLEISQTKKRNLLGNEIGIIFQDYQGSFTPYLKIGSQMIETLRAHQMIRKKEAKNIAYQVLEKMDLDAARVYKSYPFQLSGGQVQRAQIAMMLALRPALLICDEITTALDVMSGENVLNYIDQVRKETGCAVLMVTHDLAQAYKRTDRMYVMYKGEIVEEGLPEQIRCYHKHPYTKKLCSCLLTLPDKKSLGQERGNSL